MRSLFVSAALALMVGAADAQTPSPGPPTASPQAPAPPGQAQPSNVAPPTFNAGPYRLDLSGDANITGTYRVNGVPISATSNWTQAGDTISYSTGNVGIGTTAPSEHLHVVKSGAGGIRVSASLQSGMSFTAANGTGGYYLGRAFGSDDANDFFLYDVAHGKRLFGVTTTGNSFFEGNVGIGINTPTEGKLQVETDIGTAVYAHTSNGTAVSAVGLVIGVSGESHLNYGVVGKSHSGFGVAGTSDSGYGVYGAAPAGYGVYGSSLLGYAGYFNGRVNVIETVCAANISCASDARLKQDVAPLSYGLREVLRLRPVRWEWKDTTTTQLKLGLIAQDVEPILPELILHNVDMQGSLGLNYFGFVPVLINAIHEQQDTITALKAENASLDARIRALEQALLPRSREPR